MVNFKSLIKNKIFQIILVALVLLSLPVGLYLVQQQQKLKSRASISGQATLTFDPVSKADLRVGDNFDVNLILNVSSGSTTYSVSAVDVTMTFDDHLRMMSFSNSAPFSKVLVPSATFNSMDNVGHKFRYIAFDNTTSAISGNIVLGRVTFKVEKAGDTRPTFDVSKSMVTASSVNQFLQPNTIAASYNTTGSASVAVLCNAVAVNGLSVSTTMNGMDGGPVYIVDNLFSGSTLNRELQVTRNPTDADVSTSPSSPITAAAGSSTGAPAMSITRTSSGGTIRQTLNIPSNSGSRDNTYLFTPITTKGASSDNCLSVTIIVKAQPPLSPTATPSPTASPTSSPTASPTPALVLGDADLNGCVDDADRDEVISEWIGRSRKTKPDGTLAADWGPPLGTPNGRVDVYDFSVWQTERKAGRHPCRAR